jgi:hypothetical protein
MRPKFAKRTTISARKEGQVAQMWWICAYNVAILETNVTPKRVASCLDGFQVDSRPVYRLS